MTPEQVTERMQNGEQLRNYGNGWFVQNPYRKDRMHRVTDEIVGDLEADGLIKLRMLMRSIEAVLA